MPESRTESSSSQTARVSARTSSGLPDLNRLLGGSLQFLKEAVGGGHRSVFYSFEEEENTLVRRSRDVSIPVEAMQDAD